MICPNCGAEVAGNVNFCENCGAPIEGGAPSAHPASSGEQAGQPIDQTQAMPSQSGQQQTWQSAQQPSRQPGAYGAAPGAPGAQPSAAPFVLAIIALVTAILGLFPISIILAIVALVMNSGQRKRGETSTKQTPTTVMSVVSLVLSAIMLVLTIALGSLFMAAVVNGGFDLDLDDLEDLGGTPTATLSSSASSNAASSSSASSPSSASSGAASTKAGPITGTDDLVGTWKLTKLVEDGEETAGAELELMENMGLEISLSLNQDGSCAFTLFGVEMQGIWEAPSPYTVYLMLDDETIDCSVDVDTAELYLEDDDDQITFTKQ